MRRQCSMREETVLGTLSITNGLAIAVLGIEYDLDDKVIYRFSNETKTRKAKVYTTQKGRSYFKIRGQRYYLDEFIKGEM